MGGGARERQRVSVAADPSADHSAPVPSLGAHSFGAFNAARAELAAPCERVWALLFDRTAWMPGFAFKRVVDGMENAVGERAHYTSRPAGGGEHTRLEEILHLEPARRLVLRLATVETDATTAFADWRLQPTQAGCRLELNLFWLDLPQPGMAWPATCELRAGYIVSTQAVIEAHLVRMGDALAGA